MEDMKRITLIKSIPIPKEGGGTVDTNTLTLGRLKAKHLKYIPDSMLEGDDSKVKPHEVIPLIAALADIPMSAADEIDIEDLIKIASELESFLAPLLESDKAGKK